MNEKTILITGGTSGIGRETAVGLAKMGAHIVVTGRNAQRGEVGIADIKARSGSEKVDLLLADMSSMGEVRRMAAEFIEKYDRLDVLINNVGLVATERWETVDGYEAMLAVNVLAPMLLTHELLPMLKQNANSRVIFVTGGQLADGSVDFNNLQAEKEFLSLNTYSHAKRVMMAGVYAFAQRVEGTGISINAAYPGAAGTNMTADLTPESVPQPIRLVFPLFKWFMSKQDPANAAVSSIYLASSPEAEGVSGQYYSQKASQIAWPAKSGELSQRVWEITMDMLGIEDTLTV
ncbi:MAG: SDR family NAD(P)-dependent oxidoreductase [Chloroflexota bacterium]